MPQEQDEPYKEQGIDQQVAKGPKDDIRSINGRIEEFELAEI